MSAATRIPRDLTPLKTWAEQHGVAYSTAQSWAAANWLDAGPQARRLGFPGALATQRGRFWFVHQATLAPEDTGTLDGASLAGQVAELQRQVTALYEAFGRLFDQFAPSTRR